MPKPLPIYAEDLVKELMGTVKEQCPSLSMTDREVWFYAGQRYIVRSLETRLKQTNEKEGG